MRIRTLISLVMLYFMTSCSSLGNSKTDYCDLLWQKGEYSNFINACQNSLEKNHVIYFRMGYLYYHGINIPANYNLAVKNYLIAASQGYAPAEYNLGLMYLFGQGVHKDEEHAFWWISRAADQNYNLAKEVIAKRHYHKDGTSKDFEKYNEQNISNNLEIVTEDNNHITEVKPIMTVMSYEALYCQLRQASNLYLSFPSLKCIW